MAVKIRLKRMGKIRTPFYRVIVTDARNKRNGRAIEEIGTYNPKTEPSLVHIESERAQYWLGVGAQPSEAVAALLKLTGDWQRFKGEAAPEPLKVAAPKRDKAEIFNEALKDAHGEPRTEAVTAKKAEPATAEPARSEATKTEATPSEPATSEPAASDAESKTGAEESAAATRDGGSQGAAAASESAGD